LRAIRLFTTKISDSVLEGQGMAKDASANQQVVSKDDADAETDESGEPREKTRAMRIESTTEGSVEPPEAAIM